MVEFDDVESWSLSDASAFWAFVTAVWSFLSRFVVSVASWACAWVRAACAWVSESWFCWSVIDDCVLVPESCALRVARAVCAFWIADGPLAMAA